MMDEWKKLGEYLIIKFNDQVTKVEEDGKFKLTEDSICVPPVRPCYSDTYREIIVKTTGTSREVPVQE